MKNYLNFLKPREEKRIINWIDKLSFPKIFLLWVSTIVVFGVGYFFLQNGGSFLSYTTGTGTVTKIIDAIYFSFVTATTTGFGDIIPVGFLRIITILEVIFGLILIAIVTSKIVSIKQDVILSELYEISFNERVNRLRSSLLLFRQNLDKVITKVEDGLIRKSEVNNLYTYFSSFELIITEIRTLISSTGKSQFIKNLDSTRAELMFNSILSSFEKINELILIMNQNKVGWKNELNLLLLNRCLEMNGTLFNQVELPKILNKEVIKNLPPTPGPLPAV